MREWKKKKEKVKAKIKVKTKEEQRNRGTMAIRSVLHLVPFLTHKYSHFPFCYSNGGRKRKKKTHTFKLDEKLLFNRIASLKFSGLYKLC